MAPVRAGHDLSRFAIHAVVQRARAALTIGERVVVQHAIAKAIRLCGMIVAASDQALAAAMRPHLNARPTPARLAGFRHNFQHIAAALSGLAIDNIIYDPDIDAFAQVVPDDPSHSILLGNDFFTAARVGEDSVAGTLIHEASHFLDVHGTDDHAYGDDIAGLAYALARNNADTMERVAESFDGKRA